MNLPENRDPTYQGEGAAPTAALLSALTTEHYTLQSARASTVVEANGRSLMFLSAGERRHRRSGARCRN